MSDSAPPGDGTATAPPALASAHVSTVAAACAAALRSVSAADWSASAAGLDWSCSATAQHIVGATLGYATQLSGTRTGRRGIAVRVTPDGDPSPEDWIQAIEAVAALHAIAVAAVPPQTRAGHVFGESGPSGFAAMGVTELAVHTRDITAALGGTFTPPRDPVVYALDRLFRNVPEDTEPWDALLWCTGRAALPGRPRLETWRWYSEGP